MSTTGKLLTGRDDRRAWVQFRSRRGSRVSSGLRGPDREGPAAVRSRRREIPFAAWADAAPSQAKRRRVDAKVEEKKGARNPLGHLVRMMAVSQDVRGSLARSDTTSTPQDGYSHDSGARRPMMVALKRRQPLVSGSLWYSIGCPAFSEVQVRRFPSRVTR